MARIKKPFSREYIGMKHKSKVVPHLAKAMELADAGNVTLGHAAGADPATIQKGKRGEGLRPAIAEAIMEALCTRTFKKQQHGNRRGRKSQYAE